jgi:hypothetical protein
MQARFAVDQSTRERRIGTGKRRWGCGGKKSWHVRFSGNPRAVPVILSAAKNLDRAVFHPDSSLRSE